MILGDIGTEDNAPYNTTDFYGYMDEALGVLPENEKFAVYSQQKPTERYLGAFHYQVNGVDFIGVNIHPDTAFNSHEGYYSDETLVWVKNKLNEIDPDGNKVVFVIGHLSAIYYYNDGEKAETMINGNRDLFYDIFKGHRNAFYLYGHLHGERSCYQSFSSGAVLHIANDGQPLGDNLREKNSKGKRYDYSLVHMGGLRPFQAENFETDGVTGFGGENEKCYHAGTGTPTLAQYLVFEVYHDKVVFFVRNTGSKTGYTQKDKPKKYTVFIKKGEKRK